MYVRKKKNKSGVVSIQIIDKSSGKYKMIKTIGSSDNPTEIDKLYRKGKLFISSYENQQSIDFDTSNFFYKVKESIKNIEIAGVELLLGKLYSEVGFDQVDSELFRYLVIVRLSHPASKLKTAEYLGRYFSVDINEDKIYRYMDKLYEEQKELIQQISYKHTLATLGNQISVVFYDVTTLYFQIDNEDETRKRGFSKDGKHQLPQIVLGLLVSVGGYPLAFEIFEGNKFEGHTMLPVLEGFMQKFNLGKPVIVADSGLLSNENITNLQEKGYGFILGARIKNESKQIKKKIFGLGLKNGESGVIEKTGQQKLIVSYSEKRAKKDKHNREKGLKRLEKGIKSGKLTKSNINKRGYNKYLKMDGEIELSIDKEKFEEDGKWDGLKGYLTNTSLSKEETIENYKHLWKIEKAFRVAKHDLRIRPIYHWLQKRIESHIIINFASYKIYKELERQLEIKKSDISPEKAIEISKSIYAVQIMNPLTDQLARQVLILNEEQKYLAGLFNF